MSRIRNKVIGLTIGRSIKKNVLILSFAAQGLGVNYVREREGSRLMDDLASSGNIDNDQVTVKRRKYRMISRLQAATAAGAATVAAVEFAQGQEAVAILSGTGSVIFAASAVLAGQVARERKH